MAANEAPKTVPKHRRRWFQFSLRSLLVLMTVLCVWLAVTVNRARNQREAVAAIRELRGYVFYSYQYDYIGGHRSNAEPPSPKWLRQFIGEDYFSSVTFVYLSNSQVTDVDLEHFNVLTNLQYLHLSSDQVSDEGLAHLKGLTHLQFLDLRCNHVNCTLKHMKRLANLEELILQGSQFHDTDLVHLEKLT